MDLIGVEKEDKGDQSPAGEHGRYFTQTPELQRQEESTSGLTPGQKYEDEKR